jgi:hypothetical protein
LTSVDLITFGLLALQVGFDLMKMVYLISGLEDLFVDLLFFAMKAKQWFAGNSGRHRPSIEEMAEKREQPFALMFPVLVGAPRPRFSTSKGGAEGAEGRGEPGASINITGWQPHARGRRRLPAVLQRFSQMREARASTLVGLETGNVT